MLSGLLVNIYEGVGFTWCDAQLLLSYEKKDQITPQKSLALRKLWVPGNLWWCEWKQQENQEEDPRKHTNYGTTFPGSLWLHLYKPLRLQQAV